MVNMIGLMLYEQPKKIKDCVLSFLIEISMMSKWCQIQLSIKSVAKLLMVVDTLYINYNIK